MCLQTIVTCQLDMNFARGNTKVSILQYILSNYNLLITNMLFYRFANCEIRTVVIVDKGLV